MAKQKFGLGRGLDALISGASEVRSPNMTPGGAEGEPEATPEVPIDSIIPNPRQPRKVFRDDDPKLLELSASIKEHGLIQPIVVTRLDQLPTTSNAKSTGWFDDEGDTTASSSTTSTSGQVVKYQIIAGERRWRASKLAGLTKVPVVIKEVTPQQMLEMALIENIQRADLNPIEEAMAYQSLIQEFGLTQEAVARQVGKDRSTVANSLRLLQLAARVREMLMNQLESFTEGHARALIVIRDEEDQIKAMNQIIAQRYTVRQAEELAQRYKNSEDVESAVKRLSTPDPQPPELEDLKEDIRNTLMVKVDLKYNAKGKGTLVLHFNDQEELESLYNRLTKRDME